MADATSSKQTYAETKRAIQRLKAQQSTVRKLQAEIEESYENVYKEKRESLLKLKYNIRQALFRNLKPKEGGADASSTPASQKRGRSLNRSLLPISESTASTSVTQEEVMKYLLRYRDALKQRESRTVKGSSYAKLMKRHSNAKGPQPNGSDATSTFSRHHDVEPNRLLLPRKFMKGGEGTETTLKIEPRKAKAAKILRRTSQNTPWAMDPSSFTHKQIVCGKQYSGEYTFLSRPQRIEFRDFELDRKYEKTVELTNISWTINRFKKIEVEEGIEDVLSVQCNLPGLMSAGMSCNMVVTFQPKALQDITGFITILAETGPVKIPVECITKKAKAEVSAQTINLPSTVIGESSHASLELSNVGAIPLSWKLSVVEVVSTTKDGEDVQLYTEETNEAEDALGILADIGLSFPKAGKIGEYAGSRQAFAFSPKSGCQCSVRLKYAFTVGSGNESIPDIFVRVNVVGEEMALSVLHEVVDFKYCKYKSTYRCNIQVNNTGKTALKCCVVQRPELRPYIEFLPDIGYCQAGKDFTFAILFTPKEEMEKTCDRWIKEGGLLEVPFKIYAPAQPTPILFNLKASLTPCELSFEPSTLDFGRCIAEMPVGRNLRIHNKGKLPVKVGLKSTLLSQNGKSLASTGMASSALAAEQMQVKFKPNDGFCTILPNSSADVTVSFFGTTEGVVAFQIVCYALGKSGQPSQFHVPSKAEVIHIPLRFSTFHLQFPPTVIKQGSISQASVVMRNTSGLSSCKFQFKAPTTDLSFSPIVGEIPPKGTARVQVKYEPFLRYQEGTKEQKGEEGAEGEAEGEGGGGGGEDEKASQGKEESVAPFRIPDEAYALLDTVQSVWAPCVVQHDNKQFVVNLNLQTCMTQTKLKIHAPGRSLKPRDNGIIELNFGTVALGEQNTITLRVSSDDVREDIPIACSMLDHREDFQILNAVRPIEEKKDCILHLRFSPKEAREYFEKLTLSTPKENIRMYLTGEGVLPTINFKDEQDTIDMGFTGPNGKTQNSLVLQYTSKCPLKYELCIEGHDFKDTFGPKTFSCHPSRGVVVGSEGELKIDLHFQPQVIHRTYMRARVVVKCHGDALGSVNLQGRCLGHGMHLQHPHPKKASLSFGEGGKEGEETQDGVEGNSAVLEGQKSFLLHFDDAMCLGDRKEAEVEIVNMGGGGGSGEFSFEHVGLDAALAERWQITPSKGQVAAGSSTKVTVSVEMPEEVPSEFLAFFGLESVMIGRWTCKLGDEEVDFTSKIKVMPQKKEKQKSDEDEST